MKKALFGIENENKINDLIQNLYGLHGNINSYLKAAKIVFGMVFKEVFDFKRKNSRRRYRARHAFC